MTDPYCPREIEATGYNPYEDMKSPIDKKADNDKMSTVFPTDVRADICENEDNNALHPEAS